MNKRLALTILSLPMLAFVGAGLWYHFSLEAPPTEEISESSSEAYEGYTLFSALAGGKMTSADPYIHLIDMEGNDVHTWETEFTQSRFAFLDENGTLIVRSRTATQPQVMNENQPAVLQELDWDGNVIWEWEHPAFHHDMAKLPNENYLVILWEEMEQSIPGCKKNTIWTDKIAEIDRDSGEIIWEWRLQDELTISNYEFNCKGKDNEWAHVNGLEYLPETDAFLISPRNLNTVIMVSRETGDIIWEIPADTVTAQHDPTLLDNGNILIFNNLHTPKTSQVLEWDWKNDAYIWDYTSPDFFSSFISGAQRLPNGNTLITQGDDGRLFEVTSDGEIVWEYFYDAEKPSVFRAYRYGLDEFEWPFIK